MAINVLHSGPLGYKGDARWFVLLKETLVHYASFLEASLGTKPDGLILLAKVTSVSVIEDDKDARLVLHMQGVKAPESITLTALEHEDDLHKWQKEIQKACEAMSKNPRRNSQRSGDVSVKGSVKSGKLSVMYSSEIRGLDSGQSEEMRSLTRQPWRNSTLSDTPDITAKITEKDEEIQMLERRLEDARADVFRCHMANVQALQAAQASGNVAGVSNSFDLAMSQIKKHQDEVLRNMDEERRRCNDLRLQLNDDRRNHAKCEFKLQQVREQLERQKLLVENEQAASNRLRLQLKGLRTASTASKSDLVESSSREVEQADVEHWKDLNEALQLKADGLEAANADLKQTAENLHRENAELRLEVSRLEAKSKEQSEEATFLRKKAQELDHQKEENCELEQLRAQLEAKVQDMTEQVSRFQQLIEEAGISVDGAQETIVRSENTALRMKKEEFMIQVTQLTAKNRDMVRMLDRQRETADDLRRQLQAARAEQDAAWKAAREAEDRWRCSAPTAQGSEGGGGGGGGEGDRQPTPRDAAPTCDWELPAQFQDQLGPNSRLPFADVKKLEPKPTYHGTLGLSRNGAFEVRYCLLYADSLECFNEPADVLKGRLPALTLDMHEVILIEFDKMALSLLLQFQDGADIAISVRSTEALRNWYKAFLCVHNRQEQKEAVSPRKILPRKKTFFTARAGKKGTWQNISTHKDGREAGLLIHGRDLDSFPVADKPGGAHVNAGVADKLTTAEGARSVSPAASARNAGEVSDKITGNRVAQSHEEPGSCQWLKITQGSEDQRQLRRSRGEVAGKVTEEGKMPVSAKSRARKSGNKVSHNSSPGAIMRGSHSSVPGRTGETAMKRASSPGVPNRVAEIVL
mmetsp:Transcript_115607/g.299744  ORF Transcript_115607/g.299744 Transcript_115607/m.299744 type:complete len:865 (+) Transcript_115607:83-2677(+)